MKDLHQLRNSAKILRSEQERDAICLVSRLTDREVEVLRLIGYGLERNEIARLLGITPLTVKHHMYKLRMKLQLETRGAEVRLALKCGISSLWHEHAIYNRAGITLGDRK